MNKQEIFDYVAVCLLNQGELSFLPNHGCKYRGPRGLKCAVGWLIKDEIYHSGMENMSLGKIIEDYIPEFFDDSIFLVELQVAHDNSSGYEFIRNFKKRMRSIAGSYRLDSAVLD